MSLTLVYIGAAAELAPAASLRALAGGGAVFVPAGLDGDLRDAGRRGGRRRRGAACSRSTPATRRGSTDCWRAAAAGEVTVAVAGPRGPLLARGAPPAGSRKAVRRSGSSRLPARPGLRRRAARPGARLAQAHRRRAPRAVPVGPRADAARHRLLHGRRGLRAGRRHRRRRSRRRARRARRPAAAGRAARPHARASAAPATWAASPPPSRTKLDPAPRAHLRRRSGRDARRGRGQWERIKRDQEGREGVFHDVPASFPAVILARKVQQRAGQRRVRLGHGGARRSPRSPRSTPSWPRSSAVAEAGGGRRRTARDPRVRRTSSATCCSPSSTWRARPTSTPSWRCARRPALRAPGRDGGRWPPASGTTGLRWS